MRMAETWTGLQRKGMSMSRSSPSLAAAFSLREFSQAKKRVPNEKSNSTPDLAMEEIDKLGGNGRWRQRKAEDFFKRQAEEELERQREQKLVEEKKFKRKKELEARRRRQQQEEEMKRLADEEREREEQREREERRRKQEEKERMIREQEHRDWQARQPVMCDACNGTGLCAACDGKGEVFAVFLVPSVCKAPNSNFMDFGKQAQGCENCGGCRQNVMGGLQKGTGKCPSCNGTGKVWPDAAFTGRAGRTRFKASMSMMSSADFSPKSIMSSPKAFPTFA